MKLTIETCGRSNRNQFMTVRLWNGMHSVSCNDLMDALMKVGLQAAVDFTDEYVEACENNHLFAPKLTRVDWTGGLHLTFESPRGERFSVSVDRHVNVSIQ